MPSLKKLSIKYKILLIPIVGSIGFIAYLSASLFGMSKIVNELENAYGVEYQYLHTAEFSKVQLDKITETLGNAVTMGETDLLKTADQYAEKYREKITASYRIDKDNTQALKELLDEFNNYYQAAHTLSKGMIDGSINFNTLGDKSAKMTSDLELLQNNLKNFHEEKYDAFNQAFESVKTQVSMTSTLGLILGSITVLTLFIVAVPIASSIDKSLKSIINSLKNIAQDNGDLTVRLTTTNQDEIGDLVFWFNSFIEKLQGVIKDVVETATPIARTADKIQRLSQESINTFQRQSDSITSSRLSVEEMSSSVADITSNAADAVESARNANSEAKNGRSVVDKTVVEIRELASVVTESSDSINRLQEDTNKVNVVLDVIKGIAEQTNLLALNAAIEAARAGEQGRGFAVVADEVRNLASRTQESTEEINQMLGDLHDAASKAVVTMESSTSGVENTVKSANQAGESLLEISNAIDTISQMNDQIAMSTKLQTDVSSSIVNHVENIQQCADDASKASTEVAHVSNDLTDLASKLEAITLQFKV